MAEVDSGKCQSTFVLALKEAQFWLAAVTCNFMIEYTLSATASVPPELYAMSNTKIFTKYVNFKYFFQVKKAYSGKMAFQIEKTVLCLCTNGK